MASETQGLASVSHGLRRACRACGLVVLHQPSPPGDSSAGTARRASRGCRQVFGLVATAGTSSPPPRSPLPRATAPVLDANASPLTAAGQCRDGLASEDADRTGFPFHPAACGCRNRRPQHIGPMAIRQSIPKASPATSCRRSSVLRNQSRLSHASIIALRKTGGGHTNEKRAEARFSIQAMTRRLTRPRRPRLRPRPSSTGGCGPACRLPAP